MQISCEGLADMVAIHHAETEAVNKRIALVRVLAKKLLRLIERLGIGIDRT